MVRPVDDGSVKIPTPARPGWNNGIIDPSIMWGPGKGLGKGASWLQKLQMFSILKNNGVDPNIYERERERDVYYSVMEYGCMQVVNNANRL